MIDFDRKFGKPGEAALTRPELAIVKLRLYVAGQSVNSSKALANLTEFCHKRLSGRHQIQVVDVFVEPEQALKDGVLLTPTLLVLSSDPPRSLVGSLSHLDSLESLLASE